MTSDPDSILNRLAGWLMCMACLRFRFSPIHGAARALGMCPGDR